MLREWDKQGERRKHDREEERRKMARVEQAANAAFACDVGARLVKPGSSVVAAVSSPLPSSSAARPSARRAPLPSDSYANYSTAASLGYTDPDAERAQAEAERHRTQGVVGAWEVIASPTPPPPAAPEKEEQGEDVKLEAGRKHPAAAVPDDDGEDARRFRLKRRTIAAGLGEIYDPGEISIKVKKQEEKAEEKEEGASGATLSESVSAPEAGTEVVASAGAIERPECFARGWRRLGESGSGGAQTGEAAGEGGQGDVNQEVKAERTEPESAPQVKKESPTVPLDAPVKQESTEPANLEEPAEPVKTEEPTEPSVKVEEHSPAPAIEAPPAGGSLIRKRKLPAGGAARGRRT